MPEPLVCDAVPGTIWGNVMVEQQDSQPEGPLGPDSGTDPELSALPKPRRPWRLATLVSLALVAISALLMAFALRSHVAYSLADGQPKELGDLGRFQPTVESANTLVHGSAELSTQAVGYRRPLDGDRFRLAQVAGNPDLWVELREPAGARTEFFVPPTSFVGRLVPLSAAGLRHSDLRAALSRSGQEVPSSAAWLIVDGETPSGSRWVLFHVRLLTRSGYFVNASSKFRIIEHNPVYAACSIASSFSSRGASPTASSCFA
jgi:hypothetical protein